MRQNIIRNVQPQGSSLNFFASARLIKEYLNHSFRGPKTPPQIQKYQKTPRLRELFRKVRANFCLLPCDTTQEPNGNCSNKLVQMNFLFFRDTQKGPVKWCRAMKSVEKLFDSFWRFLTFFDMAPFRRPLLQSAEFWVDFYRVDFPLPRFFSELDIQEVSLIQCRSAKQAIASTTLMFNESLPSRAQSPKALIQ